jgi:hypothetical protein
MAIPESRPFYHAGEAEKTAKFPQLDAVDSGKPGH